MWQIRFWRFWDSGRKLKRGLGLKHRTAMSMDLTTKQTGINIASQWSLHITNVVVNLFLISYVIGKLVTEQLRRGKLIFLQKSVDFAAFSAKSALFAMKNILFKSLLARGAAQAGARCRTGRRTMPHRQAQGAGQHCARPQRLLTQRQAAVLRSTTGPATQS